MGQKDFIKNDMPAYRTPSVKVVEIQINNSLLADAPSQGTGGGNIGGDSSFGE